jgi:hypothetical protein
MSFGFVIDFTISFVSRHIADKQDSVSFFSLNTPVSIRHKESVNIASDVPKTKTGVCPNIPNFPHFGFRFLICSKTEVPVDSFRPAGAPDAGPHGSEPAEAAVRADAGDAGPAAL